MPLLSPPKGPDDPSLAPTRCEVCGVVKQLKDMYSMAAVYRMPGLGKKAYQCEATQHFGCSHEHAVIAILECLFEHISLGDHADADKPYELQIVNDIRQLVADCEKYVQIVESET